MSTEEEFTNRAIVRAYERLGTCSKEQFDVIAEVLEKDTVYGTPRSFAQVILQGDDK